MVKSVRLACLMCAASVYPEPGSNSLFFISINFINQNFEEFFQALKLLTFLAKKLLKNLLVRYFSFCKEIYRFGLFSKGFYCLFFNVLFYVPSLGTILIIQWFFVFVNTFFKNFLKKFIGIFFHVFQLWFFSYFRAFFDIKIFII